MFEVKSELDQIICSRLEEGSLGDIQFKYYPELVALIKGFALDALHDSSIQNLLFEEESELEEIVLESEASKRQDIGQKYWNAYFVPELGVIVQVTAINEKDAEETKDIYVKTQLEKQNV